MLPVSTVESPNTISAVTLAAAGGRTQSMYSCRRTIGRECRNADMFSVHGSAVAAQFISVDWSLDHVDPDSGVNFLMCCRRLFAGFGELLVTRPSCAVTTDGDESTHSMETSTICR